MTTEAAEQPVSTTKAHYEAEQAELRQSAVPEEQAEPVVEAKAEPEAPEQEAESLKPDAELSEAARTLRRNRSDERKAKIQREIADGVREREQTRAEIAREKAELARIKQERETLSRGEQPRRPAPTGASLDPNDPEPVESEFQDYTAFVKEQTRWAAREELRQQTHRDRERVTREQSDKSLEARAAALDAQAKATAEKYADFDVVIEPVLAALHNNPRSSDVSAFLAKSSVGGEIAYRLGKDAEALKAITTASDRLVLLSEMARLEATLLVPAKASKPTTSAPAPPSRTVGSGPTTTASVARTTADHRRIEEAEIAERRRAGHRY